MRTRLDTTVRLIEPSPSSRRSIADLRDALETGATTSVELVEAYLARIEAYDRSGIRLNAVVELNPDARAEAAASDRRRREGTTLGPLDGIPYTAKDSFMVRGHDGRGRLPRVRRPRRARAMRSRSSGCARPAAC